MGWQSVWRSYTYWLPGGNNPVHNLALTQAKEYWIMTRICKCPTDRENATNLIFEDGRQGKSKQFEHPRLLIEY